MTPQEQIDQLKTELEELKILLYKDNFSGLQIHRKDIQFNGNVGFFSTAPVDQPDTIADPTGQADDLDSEARTAINAIIDRLQELGLIA